MSIFTLSEESEKKQYAVEGAKMYCPLGSVPCYIKASHKPLMMGNKKPCTTVDNNPLLNAFDFGICSTTQKPCKSCISLSNWQNFKKDFLIGGNAVLTNESTIQCAMGGTIGFSEAAQKQVITGGKNYSKDHTDTQARLLLTKVAFETVYDVCSDEVEDFADYKNFYLLTEQDKHYHWLYQRKEEDNPKQEKPEVIPITLASNEPLRLRATVQVISNEPIQTAVEVRIRQTEFFGNAQPNFLFTPQTVTAAQGKGKGSEITIDFVSTNTPYKDTIRYIEYFYLEFECSWDSGKT